MNPVERLLDIMARLRDPDTGCPWDLEQTMASIVPYTIEEAYEVADAVARGEREDILDELGDLLFQSVFLARLAEERGWFGFDDVATAIADKLVRRHPHVFAVAATDDRPSADAVTTSWEAIKAAEREARESTTPPSQLDGVPLALPALQRAEKIGKRAARVGFDWPHLDGVFAKMAEELAELRAVTGEATPDMSAVRAEVGDVLLTAVSLCRHVGVNAEQALREANGRFSDRFRAMERLADAAGESLDTLSDDALDTLWERAKDAQ